MPPIELRELSEAVGATLAGPSGGLIDDVVHDSRDARAGALFVAIRGFTSDGHDHVEQAALNGASAACVETQQEVDLPQLIVPDTRRALARLADIVHGRPSRALQVIGVTGTNGKTTVTHMLESIVVASGRRSGVIGTVGAKSGDRSIRLARTTPEASDLQRLLREMVEDGVEVVAMEVSSHALTLDRVAEIDFAVAGFTNLSIDHLDFHPSLSEYFEAKASLFESSRHKVIHLGGWGDELAARHPDALLVGAGGAVQATSVLERPEGTSFDIVAPSGREPVNLPMAGRFNVENALVATGCALSVGVGLDTIARGLENLAVVPGRMERIAHSGSFDVYVDYAHTPDGIERAIEAARRFATGRIVVVVGAGGDRDKAKRPLMGRAAGAADVLWITSDNPRSEPPAVIIDEVTAGVDEASVELNVEPDRRLAIAAALRSAGPGDVVLILGKGHEQGQDVGGVVTPFDDRAVAREVLGAGAP